MSNRPKIVVITGPTASGKTTMGILLAKRFEGEIVSADSRQIYRGMDVGTGKPSRAEIDGVPHHLMDIKNPDEEYTVAEYKKDAIAAINQILKKRKLPIMVGGTGLYIKAVIENLNVPEVKADAALREELENQIKSEGLENVFKKLLALDPDAANIVDSKNPRRVIRALEVALTTGIPFTAQRKKSAPLFDALIIGINPPPELLRQRIERRVDAMIGAGLVEEVKRLIEKYSDARGIVPIALDTIGYSEIIDHLEGKKSVEDAVAAIKMNTWRYAKRQMTWFKKTPGIHWIQHPDEASGLVEQFLAKK